MSAAVNHGGERDEYDDGEQHVGYDVDMEEAALARADDDIFKLAGDQLPRTLVQCEDPVILPGHSEEDWESEYSRIVPPAVIRQKKQLSDRPVVTTTDKVLGAVFPPRIATVVNTDGEPVRLVQPISQKQVSRQGLTDLKDVFEFKLRDSKARETSICPVRRAIHTMLFDELVRQVTIDNPERGLLLLRIRDELRMSLDAYASLYDASADYGSLKLQEGTLGKSDMLTRIKELNTENDALRKEVKRLQTKHLAILRSVDERIETDKKKFAEEKAFWERTRQRLLQHLEAVKQMQEAEKRALREGTA